MSPDVRPEAPDPSLGPVGAGNARYRPADPPVVAAGPGEQGPAPAYGAPPGLGAPPAYGGPPGHGPSPGVDPPPAGLGVPGPSGAGYGAPGAGYGAPGYGGPVPPSPAPTTDGMAIAALVCGFVACPLGVILGIVSLGRIKRRGLGGKALAVAGIVVGALGTLLAAALLAVMIAVMTGGAGGISSTTCVNSVCETTVVGAPYTIENIGDEELGTHLNVVAVSEGSAQVQGDADTVPTVVTAGETFTVDGQEVTLLSAGGGRAVFQYRQ